jgi:hypothetical protein
MRRRLPSRRPRTFSDSGATPGIRTATLHVTDAAIKVKVEAIAGGYDRPARQIGQLFDSRPGKN